MKAVNRRLIVAFFVVLWPAISFGEPVERDANGQRIWHITDYIKGTASHVHDLLCNEIHRLNDKIKETQGEISEDKSSIDSDSKPIITAYLKRPEYLRAQADVLVYKDALDKAHADHDTDAAIQAGSLYNKARDSVAAFERAARTAANANDEVKQDRRRLATDEDNLKRLQAALAKAVQWHDELVTAIHNSFMIQWPLEESKNGTLGEIIPIEIDKDGNIGCICGVREDISIKDSGEGMAMARQRIHPVQLLIKNANAHAGDIALKRPMRFDHNVEVVNSRFLNRSEIEAIVVVQVKHADIDDLMDAISQP